MTTLQPRPATARSPCALQPHGTLSVGRDARLLTATQPARCVAKGFTRSELALVASAAMLVFSRVFGLSLVLPDFRDYASTLTASQLLVGTAFGAYGLTLALMQLPLGALSDRVGRRPVLFAGTFLFVAGSIWAATADSIGTLIAARLLQGTGAISSVAMAMVGETIPEERRTTAMALIGVPAGLGFFLGLMAGPLLSPAVGVPGLFWITAGIGMVTALPLLRMHLGDPASSPASAPTPATGDKRSLGLPVLSLAAGGFTMNYALMSVLFFLPDKSWQTMLPILAAALVVMGLASRLVDRAGLTWQPIAIGIPVLAAAGALFVSAAPGFGLYGAGVLFFGAHATLSAVLPSQVSRIAGRSGGRGHGIQNIVAYMGTFAAGSAAGALAAHSRYAFAILGVVAGLSAALVVAGLRQPRTVPAPTLA